MGRKMMASIEKQTIFELPMGQIDEITVVLDGSWHRTITRVWGRRKELDRHLFKIKEGDSFRWFECGDDMAKEILNLTEKYAGQKELCLILNPIRVKHQQPQKEFLSMWERFKRFVRRIK